ncbi:hypothetical protein DNTS_021808 [Danionella cerebrum]|uniref:Ig-like domain-containing protein n=1 Tax=Danionella cerebrum TaxID=2873325 RepID=A0A553R879_9TELE|nr:hypothetical protein DNTS_021808 [Danionella translucida]
MTVYRVLFLVTTFVAVVPVWTEKHSLYYIYTALSKDVGVPGVYEFTAMGLLDDREIDYYNSKDQLKIPKQPWMRQKMETDYWDKGTQSRKSKEQWFKVNVKILMERMRQNESDVHVLQWRHGCEIEREQPENEFRFSRGIDEYSYDGQEFLSFDNMQSQWVAPVPEAVATKTKWDGVDILNKYTKGYLQKECVDWLNKFRTFEEEGLRMSSRPEVFVFARNSIKDRTRLTLTCLATGFYPKDVMMAIRKYRTALPEMEIESTGIRPNHDGTFQLRKSVDIKEDEKADYDCFVTHKTLSEPVMVKWDGKCHGCQRETGVGFALGVVFGVLIMGAAGLGVFFLWKKKLGCFNANPERPDGQNDAARAFISNQEPPQENGSANGHAVNGLSLLQNDCTVHLPTVTE